MHSFAWWPTLIVLAVATFTDLRNRRIPNWLVLPFLVAGIGVSGWLHGWHGIGQSFAGLLLALAIYGTLFLMGGMGAGDVKLCAAIGTWIGPGQMFVALVMTSIAGGIIILCWALVSGFSRELFRNSADIVFRRKERGIRRNPEMALSNPLKRKLPYAPAIAIGTMLSFFAR
jgi:prepilin peptidase CpaA